MFKDKIKISKIIMVILLVSVTSIATFNTAKNAQNTQYQKDEYEKVVGANNKYYNCFLDSISKIQSENKFNIEVIDELIICSAEYNKSVSNVNFENNQYLQKEDQVNVLFKNISNFLIKPEVKITAGIISKISSTDQESTLNILKDIITRSIGDNSKIIENIFNSLNEFIDTRREN